MRSLSESLCLCGEKKSETITIASYSAIGGSMSAVGTGSPVERLYQEFRTLVGTGKDDPNLKETRARVLGLVQGQTAIVGELFDLSVKAKGTAWREVGPKVQQIREHFREFHQEEYLTLVSCVGFNAIYAGRGFLQERKEIAFNFITDCLCSTQTFSIDLLGGLSTEEQAQFIEALAEKLADFPDMALLEKHHARLAPLFPLWQESKGLFKRGKEILYFRALLQFPDRCWEKISTEEKNHIVSIIAEFRREMKSMEEFKGFNNQKTSEDKEWTAPLIFLREVGQVYRLASFLKLTPKGGIETFFPGFSRALVEAAAPYISCLKNTATQAAFCKRLVETAVAVDCEKDVNHFDAFHILFEVIAHLHTNPAQITELQAFRFLAQDNIMNGYFVSINGESYHQLSIRVSNLLISRGVPAGLGVLGLLTGFFKGDHPDIPIPYLQALFQTLGGAIDLDTLPLDMQDNIAQAALKVLKEGTEKGDACHLLPLFTPKIPSYPAVLVQRIELIYAKAGFPSAQKLLGKAETYYQELKIEMGFRNPSNSSPVARMALRRLKGQIQLLEDLLAKAAEWKKHHLAKRTAANTLSKVEGSKRHKEGADTG